MKKSEFIYRLFEKQNTFLLNDVKRGVNAILKCMGDAMAVGNRVEIRGLGSFSCHYHAPRKARNPRTGEKVYIEGKYKPHFKPGNELKVQVNANRDKPIT